MSEDLFNQLGILLNVLAGTLLSPQLIGEQRIHKFEMLAETWANKIHQEVPNRLKEFQGSISNLPPGEDLRRPEMPFTLSGIIPVMHPIEANRLLAGPFAVGLYGGLCWFVFPFIRKSISWLSLHTPIDFLNTLTLFLSNHLSFHYRIITYWITIGALSFIAAWFLVIVLWLILQFIFLLIFILGMLLSGSKGKFEWVLLSISYFAVVLELAMLGPGIFVVIPLSVLYYAALVSHLVALATRWLLSGGDRLFGHLTILGLIAFLIGNALQFVATLFPK